MPDLEEFWENNPDFKPNPVPTDLDEPGPDPKEAKRQKRQQKNKG